MDFTELFMSIAFGDAFLFGIEFASREWIRQNVDFTQYVFSRDIYSAPSYRTGDYSDDTEMTIGVAKAMMDSRPFSEELLVEYWKAEYEDSKKTRNGVGRAGHGSIKDYYEGKKSLDEIREFQRNRDYPGNAASMRVIPLGFADASNIDQYAIINSDTTHPYPKSRAASILVARAAQYLLVQGGDSSKIIQHCKQFVRDVDLETFSYIEAIDGLGDCLSDNDYELLCGPQPIPQYISRGKTIYGLPCDAMRTAGTALYIVKHSSDAFDALKRAAFVGGDIDSLGAICVGLVGGMNGLDSIPSFILDKLEGKEYLKKIADRFEQMYKK